MATTRPDNKSPRQAPPLWAAYWHRRNWLYKYFVGRTGSYEAASDLLQDLGLEVLRLGNGCGGDEQGWLEQRAYWRVIDWRRRRRRDRAVLRAASRLSEALSERLESDDAIPSVEWDGLTAKELEAVELRAASLSVKEIARRLGCKPSAIYKRLERAEQRLFGTRCGHADPANQPRP